MKTKNLLKVLFTLVAFFVASSAFSQTYPGNLDQGTTGDVDSVTAGVAVPYFVAPDPILNPSYTGPYPTDADNLNVDEVWTWWVAGFGQGGSTANQGSAGGDGDTDGPYIEVTWNAPAVTNTPETDSIYVREDNDNITCNGDTSGLEVLVFAQPGFTPVDGDNDLIEICGAQTQSIDLAEIVDNGLTDGDLKIRLDSIAVANVDPADPQSGNGDNLLRASEDTVVIIATPLSGTTQDITILNYPVTVRNGDVTRYRFRFDGDGGITDKISRKSDYLNVGGTDPADDQSWTYYAATDVGNGFNIDVVVYPRPNTGNIYYVPHDFDQ